MSDGSLAPLKSRNFSSMLHLKEFTILKGQRPLIQKN